MALGIWRKKRKKGKKANAEKEASCVEGGKEL